MVNTVQSNQLRILVADDEEAALMLYREILAPKKNKPETFSEPGELADELFGGPVIHASTQSFDLITCRQGDEAVEAVKKSLEEHRPFAVAFLDVRMPPGPDGVRTAEQIRALDSHIEIVLVTSYSGVNPTDIAPRIPPPHKLLYVQKPFHPKVIHQLALALSSKWHTEHEFRKVFEDQERRIEERTVELMNMNEHLIEELLEEIEERKRAEKHLRQLKQAVETMQLGVTITDLGGKIIYVNPAGAEMHGYQVEELLGQDVSIFAPSELQKPPTLERIKEWKGLIRENVNIRKDGTTFLVWLMSEIVKNAKGEPFAIVTSCEDITKRKKSEQEIKFLAYHDVLTGLPNRKSFYMRLEDELIRSHSQDGDKRRVKGHKWALLFLDVDKFKYVNDTLGHDAGDELLKLVAVRLQTCLRESDHIFRLGGDEFTIILNDLIDDTDMAKVAKKIREEIARPCYIKDHKLYITASIGISIYPDDGDDVQTLVKNADIAMYAAKEENRGYRFFTEEMNKKALERMMLENNLRNALQNNQFILLYQPLVDNGNRIIGMEALLRWQHPELGMINPSQFIPLAEETGVIVPIGKWVLRCACQQAGKWHEMGHKKLYVAVNLSARQFREPDLVETIEQVLEVTDLPPDCLKLEVTESSIMENPEQAIAKMEILRTKGVHFSIDDFGTGYSSLSYLRRFPVDTLKIDRSFVVDATMNEDDQEIIKTIISMARNLGMDTVAEGVETKEQQDFLIHHGCHMMQGYYFSHPMPAERFKDMLQTRGALLTREKDNV